MRDEFKGYCHEGAMAHIVVNNAHALTEEQTLAVFRRIRAAIADGQVLLMEDSDEIGNKYTQCTWGLCSDMSKYWPTPELHVFPQEFADSGRVAPLIPTVDCPMRTKPGPVTRHGCFWSCRIFRTHLKTPNREEALGLYDSAIADLQVRASAGD
jgi:hypothetical protein